MRGLFMRDFDYRFLETIAIPSDIVSFLVQIHEFKGKQFSFYNQQPEVLQKLAEVAKIQSTGASNRIEGIRTTDQRLQELKNEHVVLVNRDEEEILGYRTVLDIIHESHDYITVMPNVILQLHRGLYKFSHFMFGGNYKSDDNVIREVDLIEKNFYRFTPVPANETPASVEAMCDAYNDASKFHNVDPLLIDIFFILDFLCIHPFNNGNGRMSRLLTQLLFYRHGYIVGKYVSIESLIEKTKDDYYSTLQQSLENWHDGKNDVWPFTRYMLGILLAAYREFDSKVVTVSDVKMTKEERIRNYIKDSIGLFSKSDIARACPDISVTTIEKVLGIMKNEDLIQPIGSGRGTKWCKR